MADASETFYRAFSSSTGHLVADCQCGRTHFSLFHDEGAYDEGEYEDLIEKMKKEPDKYIGHDESSVSAIYLNGVKCIEGCTCEYLRKVEDFIWKERLNIIDYLKRRINKDLKQKEKEAAAVNSL